MSKITAADHSALRDAVLAGDSWRAIGRQFGVHHNAAKKAWEQIAAERGAGWAAGNDPKAAAIAAIGTDTDPAVAYMAARQGRSAEQMAELLMDPTEADDEPAMDDRSGEADYSEREESGEDITDADAKWFPAGVCSPTAFRHLIVAEGIVPDRFRRQQVYSWIKSSKRNPFPVKHYATATDVRDEATDFTRPGVQVDDAREWVKAWVAAKAAK